MWQTPWLQMLNVAAAVRFLRVALHHPKARSYLSSVGQITPVLAHFGSLVMCFVYFSAVVSMEMLAKEPGFVRTGGQNRQPSVLVYENACKEKLPNFDCISSALLSMFMMFTGDASPAL